MRKTGKLPGLLAGLLRSWFALTSVEQKAVFFGLVLFLLGVIVRLAVRSVESPP